MKSTINQKIWRFIVGDTDLREFERWVSESPDLEETLGEDIYLDLISSDYGNPEAVATLQHSLETWARDNLEPVCFCWTWRYMDSFIISNDLIPSVFYDKFSMVKRRKTGINVVQCTDCQSHFYVAHDTYADRILTLRLTQSELDDILKREIWPTCFDDELNVKPVWIIDGQQ